MAYITYTLVYVDDRTVPAVVVLHITSPRPPLRQAVAREAVADTDRDPKLPDLPQEYRNPHRHVPGGTLVDPRRRPSATSPLGLVPPLRHDVHPDADENPVAPALLEEPQREVDALRQRCRGRLVCGWAGGHALSFAWG